MVDSENEENKDLPQEEELVVAAFEEEEPEIALENPDEDGPDPDYDEETGDLELGDEGYQAPLESEEHVDARKLAMEEDLNNPVVLVERVYHIWWNWADFHLYIISPAMELILPQKIIMPEVLPNSTELEFVYPIHDFGTKLSVSKAEDMYSSGMSMCKLYYTIEKMIHILVDRLKSGGISTETEVQVAFGGHQLAQRKAFESIINLSYNVVVTNFDPGLWGERYLQTVKRIADKGYGYPPEAPRDTYRHPHQHAASGGIRQG
ncbi:MAG: virulence factor [Legionella sp.]|jgi:hypothetical protein